MLSGCSGSDNPDPIKTKYYDADRRFGQSVDGGFADLREIFIPQHADELTLRASFISDEGISFSFRDPDGRLVRSVAFPRASGTHEMQWVEAAPPKDGTWRFGITCDRRCEYAFGFYFDEAVDSLDKLSDRYKDAQKRFNLQSEGPTEQKHSFVVPEGTTSIALKWSADAGDGFSFVVKDAMGNHRTSMNFPGRVSVDDLSYIVIDDPEPGTWSFELGCDAACDYAFGFYFA